MYLDLRVTSSTRSRRSTQNPSPITPAIALSLILTQLAKPPFNNGFITFSFNPQFVTLDPSNSLDQTITSMQNASWGMNTD